MSTGMNRRNSRTYASLLDDEWQLETNWTAKPTWKKSKYCKIRKVRKHAVWLMELGLLLPSQKVVFLRSVTLLAVTARYRNTIRKCYYCVTTSSRKEIQRKTMIRNESSRKYSDWQVPQITLFSAKLGPCVTAFLPWLAINLCNKVDPGGAGSGKTLSIHA